MKLFMNVAAGAALMLSANVFAANAAPTSMSCSDFKPTPEAQARFAELKGACEEIVAMNGHYYAKVSAVVRKVQGNTVTLNITKTNNTVTMTPNSDLRVLVAGSKTRPRDLKKGQEIHIYLSTEEFSQPMITDVALVQDQGDGEPVAVPVEQAKALPTTASLLPTVAISGLALLLVGLLMQRRKRFTA
jgi:hypothetical protein